MREINIPILDCQVNFVLGKADLKKFFKKYNRLPQKHLKYALQNAGYCWDLTRYYNNEFLVYIHSEDVNTLIHECVHAVHFIMQHSGIPISMKNTEIQAYLAGFLVSQISPDLGNL